MTERLITHGRAIAATGMAVALGLLAVAFLAGGEESSVRQEEAATTIPSAAPAPVSTPGPIPVPSSAPSPAPATTTSEDSPGPPAGTPASGPPAAPPASRVPAAASPLAAAWLAAGARNVAGAGAPAVPPSTGGAVPVRIDIPAIGVSAPVDPLGLNPDGTLQVPGDFSRTGWYTGRPGPGEVGPAVIVGHVDSRRGPAVFFRLRHLPAGAEVVVHRQDGWAVTFVVERSAQVPKSEFPTEEVYGPTPGPTLRLVTCGGAFDRRSRHYRDNTIVFLRIKG